MIGNSIANGPHESLSYPLTDSEQMLGEQQQIRLQSSEESQQPLWSRVVNFLQTPVSQLNPLAKVFCPASMENYKDQHEREEGDVAEFSKAQVSQIIRETAAGCEAKAAELYMPKINEFLERIRDLEVQLQQQMRLQQEQRAKEQEQEQEHEQEHLQEQGREQENKQELGQEQEQEQEVKQAQEEEKGQTQEEEQEQEQKQKAEQLQPATGAAMSSPPPSLSPGDYVELVALKHVELNGERGTVGQLQDTGRFSIELGAHKLFRKVCIKTENLKVIVPVDVFREVKLRRDKGQSVASLVAEGFSVAAIQRDNSEALCNDCFRPRHMCACTF